MEQKQAERVRQKLNPHIPVRVKSVRVKADCMARTFQADLVPGPPNPAAVAKDHLPPRADWEPRSFARTDEQDDGLLIHVLVMRATQDDHPGVLGEPDRGHGRETLDTVGGFPSMARNIVLSPADLALLREACVAMGGEIKISPEGDFQANFTRTASAVHLAQLGYFEALPDDGWRIKSGLKAKVKAALKVEQA